MEHLLVTKLALIAALGVAAQWLAWRFTLPAIVLLAIGGLLVGPVLGWLDPAADMGGHLRPIISVAVALILFEGGLNLQLRELRRPRRAVGRLVWLGIPIAWALGSLAAHHLAGMSWPIALIQGAILVVTGPTVILPLLRQARLSTHTGSVLKWEGIVNDPIGALLAVMLFELAAGKLGQEAGLATDVGRQLVFIGAGAAIGWAAGSAFAWLCRNGHIAEYLKGPLVFALVLVVFAIANTLQREGGLVAVTVFGVTLANSRFPSADEIRRLQEYVTVLLVSGVFIVLTATLEPAMLAQLTWRDALFVAAVLFVVRPLSVGLATIRAGLNWRQRALIGWIAPRGIVAVAMAGLFGPILVEMGYPDAARLVPLTFAIVFATVLAHGFTIRLAARALGLAAGTRHGVLLTNANPWTVELARALNDNRVPVLLTDGNWHRLLDARKAAVPVFHGELMSEPVHKHIDFNRYDHLIAATDNDAYNALVCTHFGAMMGRNQVYQLPTHTTVLAETAPDEPIGFRNTARGQVLLGAEAQYERLIERMQEGWHFQAKWIDRRTDPAVAIGEGLPVLRRRPDGDIQVRVRGSDFTPEPGDLLLVFAPPAEGAAPGAKADESEEPRPGAFTAPGGPPPTGRPESHRKDSDRKASDRKASDRKDGARDGTDRESKDRNGRKSGGGAAR